MKIKKRALKTSFLVGIIIFQAISGTLNIAAKELNKIKIANQYGPYYQENRKIEVPTNTYIKTNNINETIIKPIEETNPVLEYDQEKEIVEERSINTKTYEVSPGIYTKEI